ncbi:MAG: amidase family protein, partial [Ilumatobacteraceae bacterium]
AHHPPGGAIQHDCVAAAESAARMLEGLGHSVEYAHPAALADADGTARFMALWSVGAAMNLAAYGELLGRPLTESEVEPMNWAQAEFARRMSGVDHAAALAAVADFRRRCLSWWAGGFDLLVTPTTAQVSPPIGDHANDPASPMEPLRRAAEWVAFTPAFNTSGQPAVSLPLHRTASGLPVGVQLVADYGREDLLISVAAQLEAAHPWPHLAG